jgi:hypothetical protein
LSSLPKNTRLARSSPAKATIRDVARLAGVGSMTVSRVLNHHPYVTEATASRVQRAIAKLNYSPNDVARALRGSKAKTIGLIVPFLNDPFYANLAQSINAVASSHGYSVLIATSDECPQKELAEVQIMMRRSIEGLMVAPAAGGEIDLISVWGDTPGYHGPAPQRRSLPFCRRRESRWECSRRAPLDRNAWAHPHRVCERARRCIHPG